MHHAASNSIFDRLSMGMCTSMHGAPFSLQAVHSCCMWSGPAASAFSMHHFTDCTMQSSHYAACLHVLKVLFGPGLATRQPGFGT